MYAATNNLKSSKEYDSIDAFIDQVKCRSSTESMTESIPAEGDGRQEFVMKLGERYSKMLDNDLETCEQELRNVINQEKDLQEYADKLMERSWPVQAKLDTEEQAIADINKRIDALNEETKRMQSEEANLKEAKNQLTDSRNKDLKSCCDKKKNFDKVKKLVDGKFANNQAVRGIMDGIFQFCFGVDQSYNGKHRFMQGIDDFNTGVRGATCTLNKDHVKNLMESKIKGGEDSETQGEYYKELIKDSDKDMIMIIPFFKLLSRMCHLQMHMFKFYKNEKKQAENTKKIEDLKVQIETKEAVMSTISVSKQMGDEAQAMKDNEIATIHSKVQRLSLKIKETKQKKTEFKEKFYNDL